MLKPSHLVKKQIDLQIQYFNGVQQELNWSCQDALSQLANIRHMLSNNEIKIKFGGADVKADVPDTEHASSVGQESDSQEKKKPGRPKKVKKKTFSVEKDTDAVLSDSSTSSNRSQRAAAEAAGRKLVEVQNFMKATKLRRPTDFNERQRRRDKAAYPPAKSRKTHGKQSAGSQSSAEISDSENKENVHSESEIHLGLMDGNVAKIGPIDCVDVRLKNKCIVSLKKLTYSAIKSHVRSGSLESLLHKNRHDDRGVGENINLKKSNDKLVMSTEDMFQVLVDSKCSLNNKSPLSEGQFKGFDLEENTVEGNLLLNSTFVIEKNSDSEVNELQINAVQKQNILSKTISALTMEETEEVMKIDIETHKTMELRKTTKLEKTNKVGLNENINEAEKHKEVLNEENPIQESVSHDIDRDEIQGFESTSAVNNIKACNEVMVISESHSPEEKIDLRTKVIKKHIDVSEKNESQSQAKTIRNKECNDVKSTRLATMSNEECEIDSPERKIDSRTKVIKKHIDVSEKNESQSQAKTLRNKDCNDLKSTRLATMSNEECEIDSPERKIDSRTKVIKKHIDVSEKNESQSQAKTIRNREGNDLEATSSAAMTEEHLSSEQNKLTSEASSDSPLVPKGLVVKKRVEDFENLGKNVKETTGMITRHTAKNRNLPSRAVTPGNAAHNVNKKLNSVTTPVRVENTVALVQKQALEEAEKNKKEEERLKRQAKEEIAIKKKEKALKATVEESKRKREEKLKKVAAVREAAEKEKNMLSRKAEKEKEIKMQQKAAEKEKQKEEYLKTKQLTKQKALEHEERRKREEEARLARLKEQEEEHKRTLAMRERELELKKLAKENEIRSADSEKAKHKNLKLCKGAPGTSATAKVQLVNPTSQQAEACLSYELTPAREDRPLLEPKSENDYGIDHANSGDSSEDESQPKKKIPQWAAAKERYHLLKVSSLLPREIWPSFMSGSSNPDINRIFAGNPIRKRVRTSSAVWHTPPQCSRDMHK